MANYPYFNASNKAGHTDCKKGITGPLKGQSGPADGKFCDIFLDQ